MSADPGFQLVLPMGIAIRFYGKTTCKTLLIWDNENQSDDARLFQCKAILRAFLKKENQNAVMEWAWHPDSNYLGCSLMTIEFSKPINVQLVADFFKSECAKMALLASSIVSSESFRQ